MSDVRRDDGLFVPTKVAAGILGCSENGLGQYSLRLRFAVKFPNHGRKRLAIWDAELMHHARAIRDHAESLGRRIGVPLAVEMAAGRGRFSGTMRG